MPSHHSTRATRYISLILSSAAPLALWASPAAAQIAEAPRPAVAGGDRDVIVVTARKREESLLDVPVAIDALSEKDVQRYATTDLTQITNIVPQVIIARSSGAGSGASFIIRGVGSSQGDTGIEQTVTLNLDGVQLSRGRAVGQSFFDVAQVEVLKGPQALFFGKNSPGGVISVRSKGATPTFEGYVTAGYEFKTDEKFVEGAVSGPISDAFGFRVALKASDFEGYIRNVAEAGPNPFFPDTPSVGTLGNPRQPEGYEFLGRLTLEYDNGGPFQSNLKVFGSYKKENALALAETIGCTDQPRMLGQPDPFGDCQLNGVRSVAALPPALTENFPLTGDGELYSKNRFILGSWTNEVELAEDISLTSVTGYYDYKFKALDEFSYSSFGGLWTSFLEDYRSISEELRVSSSFAGPLNFTVGGLFEDSKRFNTANNLQLNRPVDPATGKILAGQADIHNDGTTYSVFGQGIWDVLPTVELAGGVRWTREEKSTSMLNTYVHPTAASGLRARRAQGSVLASDFVDENWSPEATITWRPTSYTTLYGAYKTGYKSGGFSTPQGGIPIEWTTASPRFGSETAEGFEVGAKAELLDGDLRLDAAVYSYEFKDLQQTSFDALTFLFRIRNATSAKTEGVEFDANWDATPMLSLRASAAYNDATYGDFDTSPCWFGQTEAQGCIAGVQDLTGERLARAPAWNVSGGATLDIPIGESFELSASTDVRYTSGYWLQETQNPNSWQEGFALWNASLRFGDIDGLWTLAVIGKNLTNKWYGVASTDKPLGAVGEVTASTGRPREVLIQATHRF